MSKKLTEAELNAIDRRIEEIAIVANQCHPDRDGDVVCRLDQEVRLLISKIEGSLAETEKGKDHMKTKQSLDNLILPEKFKADRFEAVSRALHNLIETYGKEFVLEMIKIDHNLVPAKSKRVFKVI